MRGCLALPFRLAFLLLLLVAGFLGWSYRREIRRQIHEWTAEKSAPTAVGQGDPAQAASVQRRIQGLRGSGRDSVVLSAGDVASLLAAAVSARLPGALDSIEVRLDDDDVSVRALVDTRRVPMSLGTLRGMIRDREWVAAGGNAIFRRTGLAEWQVDRARVRGIPFPKTVIDDVLRRIVGRAEAGAVEISLPPAVGGLRVSPTGVVLYGLAPVGGIR